MFMVAIMRINTMLLTNFFVVALLILASTKLVTSRGTGDNDTVKMIRCKDNERRALIEFKEGLTDEYDILSSWRKSKEEDCCQWKGIRCNNRTGHVTVLDLPGHNFDDAIFYLSGNVSFSLLELKHLKYLDLSNNFFDSLPKFLGSLTKLQHLNFSNNYFGGTIPRQLANLTNLRTLDLAHNYGMTVNNLDWLSDLQLLRYLDLSYMDIRSDWLQQIFKLPFLTELYFSSCNLPVPVSPLNKSSFSSLTLLAVVDLSHNNFGSPSSYNWLFNFTSSLVQIDLSSNNLSRSILENIGIMASLKYLYLKDCQLEGQLPKSFSNLSHLDTLYLPVNNFSGQLSEFLHPLSSNTKNSLRALYLGKNQLGGSLPDFTRFSSIREISIYKNKLSGCFPDNFGNLSGLVHLDLSSNQMTGSFPNLTLFSSLSVLYLQHNKLEDSIPEAYFSNLANLKYLDLSLNSLALRFSFDWVPPFQLDVIRLQSCNLGPHFPNWLQFQRYFTELDISVAGISDPIPPWFWDFTPRSEYINISYNEIEGTVPNLSLELTGFLTLDLRSNRLKGPIPIFPSNITLLHLSKNMFTGSVSFICTTPYKTLLTLDLSDNNLSGELPDCWMNVDQLEVLSLTNNNLSGKIPTSFGLLNLLMILQLRNNNFGGELPSTLKNCKVLLVLDLSENELLGEVPTWIGTHLTSLVVFSVRKNQFSGSIPPQICHLINAQVLDLSQNNLSGSISPCVNNLTSMVHTSNSNAEVDNEIFTRAGSYILTYTYDGVNALLQWKGRDSEYRQTLGLLKLIDFSNNKLVGKIPEEFASLDGLISLNLSHNDLTGNIVQKIGQMKMLEVLDLSENQLSGEIPLGLANLTFLSVLDLSTNNLSGRIPSSTQLQSFNASVYGGNEKLCGLPLPSKCPGEKTNTLPPSVWHGNDENNEESENIFVSTGLYVSLVLGFVTGFWGFLGPIILRSTWRHAYFRLLDKIKDWIYVTTAINIARIQRKIYG